MDDEQQLRAAYQTIERSLTPAPGAIHGVQRAVAARRRTRVAIAGFGAAAAVLVTMASVAAVQATGGPSSQDQPPVADGQASAPDTATSITSAEEWQAAVAPYKNRLFTAAEQDPNYAGGEMSYERREIIVYGTGSPSAEVEGVLAEAPEETTARWEAVPYSAAELEVAGDRLSEAIPRAVSTNYIDNYSRILVGVHNLPTAGPELQELEDIAADTTSIPVDLVDQELPDLGVYAPGAE